MLWRMTAFFHGPRRKLMGHRNAENVPTLPPWYPMNPVAFEFTDYFTTLRVSYDAHGQIEMSLEWTPCPVFQPQKKKKPILVKRSLPVAPVAPPPALPLSYTAEEVKEMSDIETLYHFKRITGKESLYCSHCRKETTLEEKWMYSIRKRCAKHGISANMKPPKTCSIQLQKNEYVNDANNEAYRTLKRPDVTEEQRSAILARREEKMAELGVVCRPYRYS